MIKTEIVKGELPFRIQVDGLRGAGRTPAEATMVALSVGGKIPVGMRDNKEAARYVFWSYESNATWSRLIYILEQDTFD